MNALAAEARPRLARGVRLRQDRLTGKYLLLRPERGFELRGSALEVVRLCDGASTVGEIVECLAAAHAEAPREGIAGDVTRLLGELVERRLLTLDEVAPGAAAQPSGEAP